MCKEAASAKHFLKSFPYLFLTHPYPHKHHDFRGEHCEVFDSAGGALNTQIQQSCVPQPWDSKAGSLQFIGAVGRFVHPVPFLKQLKKFLHGDSWVGGPS